MKRFPARWLWSLFALYSLLIRHKALPGPTSVTFNSIETQFLVGSGTLITTTVPAGATKGVEQVVTPGGTLKSNLPFRVVA